jgi:hypothetical protein
MNCRILFSWFKQHNTSHNRRQKMQRVGRRASHLLPPPVRTHRTLLRQWAHDLIFVYAVRTSVKSSPPCGRLSLPLSTLLDKTPWALACAYLNAPCSILQPAPTPCPGSSPLRVPTLPASSSHFDQEARPPLRPTGFSVYAYLTSMFTITGSPVRSTGDTGGWPALSRQGLSPCKIRWAWPSAITPYSAACPRYCFVKHLENSFHHTLDIDQT